MLETLQKQRGPNVPAIFGHWIRADRGECGLVYECWGGLMNAAAGTVHQLHPSQQNC